ncbi:MAG: BolA/IbaG family iron-sulfur metabolism protein [Pseudomonadales bacterium]
MEVQQLIEQKLRGAFEPDVLQVLNESNQHNVPPGSESHFKVVLVTQLFDAKREVARHQSVYKVLADELAGSIHALALHTYSPDEWQQRQQEAPNSPACLGGSKRESLADKE